MSRLPQVPPPALPAAADVVVVGAGAAGLTAALRAAEAGARVLLLNAHSRPGLKVLMSGGTRCNVTHRQVGERDFHGGSPHVVARILRAFPVDATLAWFAGLGVELKLEETGKYFPVTDDAHTVLEALLGAAGRAGVQVACGARVVRLERIAAAGGGYRLGVQRVTDSNAFSPAVAGYREGAWPLPAGEPGEWVATRAVVLATGGLSFPRTGSDGTGYALAASVGHTLVPPVPALTPLSGSDPLCTAAQGLTADAELALWVGGRREVAVRGSLLVTHFGFSGPAALDLSRHWLRAEGRGDRVVAANFVPGETRESLLAAWLAKFAEAPYSTVRRFLVHRVPERLGEILCAEAGVEPGVQVSQVARGKRAALIERVCARPLVVTGTLGYEKAECTAGGVPLAEVGSSTLESRRAPGLYLCGEILDVEGRLGGFNFQWAWSSGTVAGRAAGPQRGGFGPEHPSEPA
jgi:predicted flavoprotein YhiN